MTAEGERCLGITMSDEMSRPFTGALSLPALVCRLALDHA
jgi:hypothetical protein